MTIFNNLNQSNNHIHITNQSQAVSPNAGSTLNMSQATHGYNTRLQSRLSGGSGAAMNDPEAVNHLGQIQNQSQPLPRLASAATDRSETQESDDTLINNGSPASSEDSNMTDDINAEAENDPNAVDGSGSSSDSESVNEEEMEVETEASQESSDSDESEDGIPLKKFPNDDRSVVQIDFADVLEHIINGATNGGNPLNSISDKDSFLSSVGIDLDSDDGTPENHKLHERAEAMWTEFKSFNSSQCELLLGLDKFSIGELMAKVHVDGKIPAQQKRAILSLCSKLSDTVQEAHVKDKLFQSRVTVLKSNGESTEHLLRRNAGELANAMSVLTDAQEALQSAGYSLNINDFEVAMKSGLKVQRAQKDSPVSFKDVAGIDEAKAELQEIVDFLKSPQSFSTLGAKVPKGVLLSGPPGTGKTLLAKAVAGEAGVPFFSVSGSGFIEEYVGVGAKRVRELFQKANAHDSCILFIDELDAVGGKRNARGDGSGQEHDQTLNQLLTEMDGFSGHSGVIVMAATNRPDMLDSALKRPGRFDRNVAIPLPTVNGREAILKLHGSKYQIDPKIDFNSIARRTSGFSGAELANLINEAALLAGRTSKSSIEQVDIDTAFDKMIMGAEVPSFHMSEKNKLNTAYHESGHAIVSYMLKEHDPVYKVTIMPRGFSLGATHYLPDEDDTSISLLKLKSQLCSLMGGRIGEEILLGEDGVTTGASNDLQRASAIARKMVTEWGFSKELGPVTFKGENGGLASVSAHTAELIDQEVKKILQEAEHTAREILTANRDKLDIMASSLMEKETLTQDEFRAIMTTNTKSPAAKPGELQDLIL